MDASGVEVGSPPSPVHLCSCVEQEVRIAEEKREREEEREEVVHFSSSSWWW